jgi:hypothetical protein
VEDTRFVMEPDLLMFNPHHDTMLGRMLSGVDVRVNERAGGGGGATPHLH